MIHNDTSPFGGVFFVYLQGYVRGSCEISRFFCIFAKSEHMYTTKTFEEIKKDDALLMSLYRLCYIDGINPTYNDYTPEAKAYRETDEWKEQDRLRDEKLHRQGYMSYDDPEFGYWTNPVLKKGAEMQEYPNPDYMEGKQEYYAYFTPETLDEQWGDDWDDAPYECNAEIPYDSNHKEKDENGKWVEYNIIRVPFMLNFDGWKVVMPKDYGYNSPFSVRDINAGAVAWVYYKGKNGKSCEGTITIQAGVGPNEFIRKVEMINEAYPYMKEEEDD